MQKCRNFRFLFVTLMLICLVSAAQAATYGYLVVRGKNLDQINREIDTIERLIKTWNNGELLYKHTIVSGGAFFFKKVTATLFFAGSQKEISTFLTSGPYEGDYLRDIVVKFEYRSMASTSPLDGDIITSFTRKFSNIRTALNTIQDKNSDILWNQLPKTKYNQHLVSGKLINPVVSVTFYSVQAVEDNRLFGVSYNPNSATPRN